MYSALELVGVALISKRASRGVILGVAVSHYASGPYTPIDPLSKALKAALQILSKPTQSHPRANLLRSGFRFWERDEEGRTAPRTK